MDGCNISREWLADGYEVSKSSRVRWEWVKRGAQGQAADENLKLQRYSELGN
jgi:hypothetical protein